MVNCKICALQFPELKTLHRHLRSHRITMADYYETHYPKNNKLTSIKMKFKDYDSYFLNDFEERKEMARWCAQTKDEIVKPYLVELLKRAGRGPTEVELQTTIMPSIASFRKYFDTYEAACAEAGVSLRLTDIFNVESEFAEKPIEILIDTRERHPLSFEKSRILKLNFGDYGTSDPDYYSSVFIERKSVADFFLTMGPLNIERFRRELERAASLDSYMIIVVEESLNNVKHYKNNFGKSTPSFVLHQMRGLVRGNENCQFLFVNDRDEAVRVIEKIFRLKDIVKKVDLQFLYTNGDL